MRTASSSIAFPSPNPCRGNVAPSAPTFPNILSAAVPSVTLSGEHYNMVARYLQQNIPVKLRVNVQATF